MDYTSTHTFNDDGTQCDLTKSILKPPKARIPLQEVDLGLDTQFDPEIIRKRRVSFAGVNKIKEFNSKAESVIICSTPAYEETFSTSSDSSAITSSGTASRLVIEDCTLLNETMELTDIEVECGANSGMQLTFTQDSASPGPVKSYPTSLQQCPAAPSVLAVKGSSSPPSLVNPKVPNTKPKADSLLNPLVRQLLEESVIDEDMSLMNHDHLDPAIHFKLPFEPNIKNANLSKNDSEKNPVSLAPVSFHNSKEITLPPTPANATYTLPLNAASVPSTTTTYTVPVDATYTLSQSKENLSCMEFTEAIPAFRANCHQNEFHEIPKRFPEVQKHKNFLDMSQNMDFTMVLKPQVVPTKGIERDQNKENVPETLSESSSSTSTVFEGDSNLSQMEFTEALPARNINAVNEENGCDQEPMDVSYNMDFTEYIPVTNTKSTLPSEPFKAPLKPSFNNSNKPLSNITNMNESIEFTEVIPQQKMPHLGYQTGYESHKVMPATGVFHLQSKETLNESTMDFTEAIPHQVKKVLPQNKQWHSQNSTSMEITEVIPFGQLQCAKPEGNKWIPIHQQETYDSRMELTQAFGEPMRNFGFVGSQLSQQNDNDVVNDEFSRRLAMANESHVSETQKTSFLHSVQDQGKISVNNVPSSSDSSNSLVLRYSSESTETSQQSQESKQLALKLPGNGGSMPAQCGNVAPILQQKPTNDLKDDEHIHSSKTNVDIVGHHTLGFNTEETVSDWTLAHERKEVPAEKVDVVPINGIEAEQSISVDDFQLDLSYSPEPESPIDLIQGEPAVLSESIEHISKHETHSGPLKQCVSQEEVPEKRRKPRKNSAFELHLQMSIIDDSSSENAKHQSSLEPMNPRKSLTFDSDIQMALHGEEKSSENEPKHESVLEFCEETKKTSPDDQNQMDFTIGHNCSNHNREEEVEVKIITNNQNWLGASNEKGTSNGESFVKCNVSLCNEKSHEVQNFEDKSKTMGSKDIVKIGIQKEFANHSLLPREINTNNADNQMSFEIIEEAAPIAKEIPPFSSNTQVSSDQVGSNSEKCILSRRNNAPMDIADKKPLKKPVECFKSAELVCEVFRNASFYSSSVALSHPHTKISPNKKCQGGIKSPLRFDNFPPLPTLVSDDERQLIPPIKDYNPNKGKKEWEILEKNQLFFESIKFFWAGPTTKKYTLPWPVDIILRIPNCPKNNFIEANFETKKAEIKIEYHIRKYDYLSQIIEMCMKQHFSLIYTEKFLNSECSTIRDVLAAIKLIEEEYRAMEPMISALKFERLRHPWDFRDNKVVFSFVRVKKSLYFEIQLDPLNYKKLSGSNLDLLLHEGQPSFSLKDLQSVFDAHNSPTDKLRNCLGTVDAELNK